MSLPVRRRPYDAFLSHAHVDRQFVTALYEWLGRSCGLNIWYDAVKMDGGSAIGGALQRAIEDCRGLLLVGSAEAIKRGWVKEELEIARVEYADLADFRIIPLRLDDADVAGLIKGHSWIDVVTGKLDADTAARILRAFYPGDSRPDARLSRDVYVSGSWHAEDNTSAQAVFTSLCNAGFRLIGDAKDQKGFRADRIQSIVESCGAFIGVIPFRNDVGSATADSAPYKYFLRELDAATRARIPAVVVADPRITRTDDDDESWIRMDTHAGQCPSDVQRAVEDLWERWVPPPRPHYVFLATDLESGAADPLGEVRHIIERVTGMTTIVGNEVNEPDLPTAIAQAIRNALLVIADLTGAAERSFNVDCCIEAGMALAYDVDLALIAAGKMRSPPFMLRRAGQLSAYGDEVEHLGVVHRIARQYRRRVLNAEL